MTDATSLKTRGDLFHHATELTALAQGLAVLIPLADCPTKDLDVRRAGNALLPLAEEIAARLEAMADALDSTNWPGAV